MKAIIIAGMIGLASIFSSATPSLADSVTVTVGDSHHGRSWDRHHDRRDWRHGRHYYRHGPRCRVKTVRYRHHHRWVYSKKRICRW
jgi:hypothetical protein